MLARGVTICMVAAFTVSKCYSFWQHWHRHTVTWQAADMLLNSDVCMQPYLRMGVGEFDNCDIALAFVSISPLFRALYNVAEELHVCGQSRCAILYMDVTDRLVYILPTVLALVVLVICKCGVGYRLDRATTSINEYRLPCRAIKHKEH
jgi:hypothetical protein